MSTRLNESYETLNAEVTRKGKVYKFNDGSVGVNLKTIGEQINVPDISKYLGELHRGTDSVFTRAAYSKMDSSKIFLRRVDMGNEYTPTILTDHGLMCMLHGFMMIQVGNCKVAYDDLIERLRLTNVREVNNKEYRTKLQILIDEEVRLLGVLEREFPDN